MKKILEGIQSDLKYIRDHELQPGWYKIFKIFLVLGGTIGFYLIFGGRKTIIFLGCFLGLGLALHMVYRVKTIQFTQSWLDFVVEEIDGELRTKPIGIYYYTAVLLNLVLAFLASYFLAS